MSQTVVVGVRLPVEDATAFREQAERFGLTPSSAGAALIAGHLAIEVKHREEEPAARVGS